MSRKKEVLEWKEFIPNSLIAKGFHDVDYFDSYAILLDEKEVTSVDQFTWELFSYSPKWMDYLMALRDKIVASWGIKTSDDVEIEITDKPKEYKKGDKLIFFNIFDRTKDEILMGENDIHLDFLVSTHLVELDDKKYGVLTTAVRFNRFLGKAYFFFIKPFHQLLVKQMMKNYLPRFRKISF